MRNISPSLVRFLLKILVVQVLKVSSETGILLEKKHSDASWQWLTVYKFRAGTGWSRDGITGNYAVCDIASTTTNHTDSWLVSDIIQSQDAKEVTISLTFTTRSCPPGYPYCVTYYKVLALQTDTPITVTKQTIADGNFAFVSNATATVTWTSGQSPQDNVVNVTLATSKKNFYLAFQDIGSCTAIRAISVTYRFCPHVTSNGVTYNKTIAPALRDTEVNVTGRCLDHASSSSALLAAKCLSNGDWRTDNSIVCYCNQGYEKSNGKCIACSSGKYKATLGNQACQSCPAHSRPSMSRDQCHCESGYYRTVRELKNASCSAPPSAPRDLKTTMASPSVVIAMWSPPINGGGRNDVKYNVICQKCSTGVCTQTCNDVTYWPSNRNLTWTHVTLTGVSSLGTYRITVVAKNGVSDVAGVSYHANESLVFTVPMLTTESARNTSSYLAPSTTQPPPASDISAAIGVSVACTFIVCVLLGLLIAYIVIHKYRSRIHLAKGSLRRYSRHRKESVMTGMTELPTPREYSRETSKTSTASSIHANGIKDDIPAINIDDNIDGPHTLNSNHSTPEAWANGKPGMKHLGNGDIKVSPSGSTASVRSWFPQTDVQYGI